MSLVSSPEMLIGKSNWLSFSLSNLYLRAGNEV